jgi:hypothetical protein
MGRRGRNASFKCRTPFALVAAGTLGASLALAATLSGISAIEISAGFDGGSTQTCDTTFTGWTDTTPGMWEPVFRSSGGVWIATINQVGRTAPCARAERRHGHARWPETS